MSVRSNAISPKRVPPRALHGQINEIIMCRRYRDGQACAMVLRPLMLIVDWSASGMDNDCTPQALCVDE